MTKAGNPVLILNGYRFNREKMLNFKEIWRCVKKNRGCKARLWTVSRVVVKVLQDHNHHELLMPKIFGFAQKVGIHVAHDFMWIRIIRYTTPSWSITISHRMEFVRKVSGNKIAIVNDYTFFCHRKLESVDHWSCTYGWNCGARFSLSKDQVIISRAFLKHNHDPPKFHVKNGVLFKIYKKN
ncbi:unnamed protein product [Colias eurytheme]|nr:unnamed protein product [Colias eurytheme]